MRAMVLFAAVWLVSGNCTLDAADEGASQLSGKWRVVEFISNGKTLDSKSETVIYEFSDRTYKIARDGKLIAELTFTWRPKSDPPQFESIWKDGDQKEKELYPTPTRSIVKIENGEMVRCYYYKPNRYPNAFKSEFRSDPDESLVLMRLRKI